MLLAECEYRKLYNNHLLPCLWFQKYCNNIKAIQTWNVDKLPTCPMCRAEIYLVLIRKSTFILLVFVILLKNFFWINTYIRIQLQNVQTGYVTQISILYTKRMLSQNVFQVHTCRRLIEFRRNNSIAISSSFENIHFY